MHPNQTAFSPPASPPSARAVAPQRRRAGRPAKLSPALILQTSRRILDRTPVEHFMVKSVAGPERLMLQQRARGRVRP